LFLFLRKLAHLSGSYSKNSVGGAVSEVVVVEAKEWGSSLFLKACAYTHTSLVTAAAFVIEKKEKNKIEEKARQGNIYMHAYIWTR
jgi:hypothetical protein